MHFIKRTFPAMLALLVLLLSLQISVAAESIETDRATQLDILYEYGGTPIPNAQLYIYRVGSVSSGGAVSLLSPYSTYPLDPGLIFEDSRQAATLLHHYILLNKTAPDAVLSTDEDGRAQGNLGVGLYLFVPQKYHDANGIFRSEPALISLPYRASTSDPWAYQVSYNPKCSFTPQNRIGTTALYVTKKWEGGSEADRPEKITVYLLRDSTIMERVELSDTNRWLYRWNDLSEFYDWRVVEEPIPGYTVTISGNTTSILLTNTSDLPEIEPDETEPDETEPDETEETTQPTETTEATTPTQPTTPTGGGGSNTPSGGGGSKLPQTGMLWWPVPVLLFLGFALIFLGVRIRRGAAYEG